MNPGTPCFIAGTPVHTEAGLRSIETVSAGTKVWAYDQERQSWLPMRVLDTETHDYVGTMVAIKVGEDTVEATKTHPFWVISGEFPERRPVARVQEDANQSSTENGRWVMAVDLQCGDVLLSREGRLLTVMSTQVSDTITRVFNLQVDRLNNYAVGKAGVLVNNM